MFTPRFLSILCFVVFVVFVPGLNQAQTRQADEQGIRDLISKLNDARNMRNAAAVAELYADDGKDLRVWGEVRGRAELTKMWTMATDHASRSVLSVTFLTDKIAEASIHGVYRDSGQGFSEILVFVKDSVKWKIQIHQAMPAQP
jgi:uncharacterized protein (TIGR02246 family)